MDHEALSAIMLRTGRGSASRRNKMKKSRPGTDITCLSWKIDDIVADAALHRTAPMLVQSGNHKAQDHPRP